MLKSFEYITELENQLKEQQNTQKIIDYRMSLKTDMRLEIFVLVSNTQNYNIDALNITNHNISLKVITEREKNYDPMYQYIFSDEYPNPNSKVDLGLVWRFDTLLNTNQHENNTQQEHTNPCNVVTFYSYKGGMGRTTTLCAYALHLAQKGKKVVILDCDFEAPGFLSFFGLEEQQEQTQKSGLVEYLLDKEFVGSQNINLANDYILEVSKDYSGEKGKIFVLPSGNLNYTSIFDNSETSIPNTHLDHYLHGLARLNISNSDKMIRQFRELFNDLVKNLELTKDDYILIDSRTGFNEIFGITALNLSNAIVGFFGSSEQTRAGLYFLLDKYIDIKLQNQEEIKQPKLLLVNSIVPNNKERQELFLKSLNNLITNYADETQKKIEQIYQNAIPFTDIPRVSLGENKVLKEIGVKFYETDEENEKKEKELLTLVQTNEFVDYDGKTKKFEDLNDIFAKIDNFFAKEITINYGELGIKELRNIVLNGLQETLKNIPLFAENANPDIDVNTFFYREYMKPFFNKEHFLIQGFKGSGKTYLYKAFKNKEITKIILDKTGLSGTQNYHFVTVVALKGEKNIFKTFPYNKDNEIEVLKKLKVHDFWLMYMLISILLDETLEPHIREYRKFYPNTQIENDIISLKKPDFTIEDRRNLFDKYLSDSDNRNLIQKDVIHLNNFLISENIKIFVLFDQLDKVSHTEDWKKIITPLIEFWGDNYNMDYYSNIYPKIFIRTDIKKELQRVNNSLSLRDNTIEIEWTPDEIYAYFFKLVFAKDSAKKAFFELAKRYNQYPVKYLRDIEIKTEKNHQPDIEKNIIYVLLNTFFGNEILSPTKTPLGSPYDFFYLNFSNANGTMVLRPFLKMMKESVKNGLENILPNYLESSRKNHTSKPESIYPEFIQNPPYTPVLHYCYTTNAEIRITVMEDHFSDLTAEGYDNIKTTITYIKSLDKNNKYKRKRLTYLEMEDLLNEIIKLPKFKTTSDSVGDLESALIANGIIEKIDRLKVFHFAAMYSYWLGLQNLDKNSMHQKAKNLKMSQKGQGKIIHIKDNGGFIYIENDGDLHFSKSALKKGVSFSDLHLNDIVTFEVSKNNGGFTAINIEKLNK